MYASASPFFFSHALLLTRLTMFLAIPQVFLFYLLAETLPNNSFSMKRKYLIYLILEAFFLMVFTLTPYVFEEVKIVNGIPYQIPGIGILVFATVAVSFSVGTILALVKKMKNSFGIVKQQIRFVFLGIVLMLGFIIATILFPVMFFQNDAFVPLTPLYVLLFLGMTAYAIVKHKFLDVRLVLVRAISYTVLVFSLAVVYVGVMLIVATQIFELAFDRKLFVLIIVLTTIVTLSFSLLSKNLRLLTDKIFFKGEYDSGKLLTELTHVMARTIDLEHMTNAILNILVKNMRVSRAAFLILEDHKLTDIKEVHTEGGSYRLEEEEFEKLREYVYKRVPQNVKAFVFREMEEDVYKKVFRSVGISIAIPISVKNNYVAFLLLDKKRSGEIYTPKDTNFLEIFAAEAGIAIQNAKSYERIKRFSEELEGRVQQRTKELKEAQIRELKKAQDVARLKDEFVFVATHELRAPITAIRLFLDMMPRKTNFFPKDVQEKLDSMSQASDHLNQLINDLLEIAQSEARSMK
ncbi:MAG: hypothetical protein KAS07_00070, partial [Candidatus Pacebacteria bacterium]|nr:hypothetical protein [Candidatus Paceibacterota bacterium]